MRWKLREGKRRRRRRWRRRSDGSCESSALLDLESEREVFLVEGKVLKLERKREVSE